jgi:hypothetical protein
MPSMILLKLKTNSTNTKRRARKNANDRYSNACSNNVVQKIKDQRRITTLEKELEELKDKSTKTEASESTGIC